MSGDTAGHCAHPQSAILEGGDLVNIMIVGDYVLVRKGIRALLETQPDFSVLAEAGTCSEALEHLQAHRVDVVILDISMPDGDGVDLIPRVRAVQPHAR
jgi:YesN/AraC family two-component response regulator